MSESIRERLARVLWESMSGAEIDWREHADTDYRRYADDLLAEFPFFAYDQGESAGCSCDPYWQDAGGGYTEYVPEYVPSCPEHSEHLWNPRTGQWVPAGVTDEMVEAGARALAGLEPGEDWPTNGALGGGGTGTRDDEYRDGLRDQASEVLAAAREARTT